MIEEIILASNSPRRKQLLKMAEIPFEVMPSNAEEIINPALSFNDIPIDIAKQKAIPLLKLKDKRIILTADTIVVLKDEIIGKPNNEEYAIETISKLSNNKHQVITGVVLQKDEQLIEFSAVTDVYFDKLSLEQITHYVQQYQPFDKAGAYAIQEWIGAIGIKKIDGCFYNVMGLPIRQVVQELAKF